MKQLIKHICQTILGISLLILISGFVVTYFFSAKVEKTVIKKIQEQMTSDLQLRNVAFSLYEKFPSASVKITDLVAFEKEGFNNDTLFYAKTTYIELNIIDIILGTVDIKRVVVDNGIINIKYDSDDNPNFAIFKTNEKNKSKLTIKNLLLINTNISCKRKKFNLNWKTQECILRFNEKKITLNAKIFSEKLIVNSRDYINKKQLTLNTILDIKKDSILIQKGSTVNIENVKIELAGEIFNGEIIDLYFACKGQEINNIIIHTPEFLKSIYRSFHANGIIDCSGNIKGLISKRSNPNLDMACSIEKGNFNLKSQPFILKNVSLNAKINNGEQSDFHNTKIEISNFN